MNIAKRTLFVLVPAGCDRKFVGGAAVGAAGAGAAYEYQNREAIKQFDEDLAAGRISQEEYDRRKEEIEKRSFVY